MAAAAPKYTRENTIVLFDVDGTLTVPRAVVTDDMKAFLKELQGAVTVGIVGGSDLPKQQEQLGAGDDVTKQYDYLFSENGLQAFQDGKEIHCQSIKEFLGEKNIRAFVDFTLGYVASLDIPVKRGTFIEFRNGMLNVSPIGRNCSQEERIAFNEYDAEHKIRETMVAVLQARFPDLGLKYSIGGQISFDVFPVGWDKTYCLQFVKDKFEHIFFFGDKTAPGGNDHEIATHELTKDHTVTSPDDTKRICTELFLQKK